MRHAPNPDQGALFTPPPEPEQLRAAGDPHVFLPRDPRPTQVQAAAASLPRSGTQRARVLMAIQRAGRIGKTDEELAAFLRMDGNSVRPRRLELVEQGLVVDSSERRPTEAGGDAIVWVTAPGVA
jgi:hypothetical protein